MKTAKHVEAISRAFLSEDSTVAPTVANNSIIVSAEPLNMKVCPILSLRFFFTKSSEKVSFHAPF